MIIDMSSKYYLDRARISRFKGEGYECTILHLIGGNWRSSNVLMCDIEDLSAAQSSYLTAIQDSPMDLSVNAELKMINLKLSVAQARWFDWISQRGKAKWLSSGEDDLKFLYTKINYRNNTNLIRSISSDGVLHTYNTDVLHSIESVHDVVTPGSKIQLR
ncbi:hypothetical protein M5K25_009477 [Dendrobium thyrsiflorum]|uniref:Uncharacterized protein n=1 Tax=Dendrobium thyrsiflorum TaxID=117978 RepID=A0ABD0V5Y7_DENTH